METISQSSKVTVEYHDPSGIFPLVSRDITSRLPLRNLNWQSPPRPLRQIKSLHVDFVPDASTQSHLQHHVSRSDADRLNSVEIVRGGAEPGKSAVKERRHQIPGFRNSPYLKVYLLRCDDKEAYKENDRRKIREWIRENAQPEGKRDDHDAFEWLILHVVIPDTIAASEPRWRESTKDRDELKERKGGTKLIGKSTRTVFDRLRADFNDSGKTGHDRVAQIRPPKETVPADLLPTPALAQTLEETPQERENAWNDLIVKFKTLILGPFDRRVREYEADIAEQEARRALPGWNFCTFFIQKEGLAKALESIGLVEDALTIYDELSIDLETVLRDIAAGEAQGTATSFAAFTSDIKTRISGHPVNCTNGTSAGTTNESRDASALFSKDYRESIVRSDISVFDIFCYVFSRKKALILRLANARSVRVQLGADANREGGEDLVLTSEVCWRTSTFIHNTARTLRQDLISGPISKSSEKPEVEIESIVCSWIWAVIGQVLDETAVPALLDITKLGKQEPAFLANGQMKRPPMSIGLGANPHPQRTTSLPGHKINGTEPTLSEPRPRTQDDSFRPPSSAGHGSKTFGLPGQPELATYRAELITSRRKMLVQLASRRGWHAGWKSAKGLKQTTLETISLTDTNEPASTDTPFIATHQVLTPALEAALSTEEEFQRMYEQLTDGAIRHYTAGTQSKSAESLVGDLAMLKCQQGHYEEALSYFQQVLPLLSTDGSWSSMELLALSTYAYCLKQLQRLDEYTQNALTLLQKVVAKEDARGIPRLRLATTSRAEDGNDSLDFAGLFQDVLSTSINLSEDIVQPLNSFFSDINLNCEVVHDAESDAFSLSLQLRHVFNGQIELQQVSAKIFNYEDSTLEAVLHSDGPVWLKAGMNTITLRGTVVTCGPYLVGTITLASHRLRFIEEMRPPPKPTALGFTEIEAPTVTVRAPERTPTFVYLYPADHAFRAEMRRSKSIHIDKPRHLDVVLNAGRNAVTSVEIKMKPTSAGLRIHLASATASGVQLNEEAGKPGQLRLGELAADEQATVVIPYTVEHANRDIAVRLEIQYRTIHGDFIFLLSDRLVNELPLDVDVNDSFHVDTLYSNFTVQTTTRTPFAVLEARLEDSPIYAVEAPPNLPCPMNVYKSQPMNLVYKISRKQQSDRNVLKRDAALALGVLYQPADALLLSCLRKAFASKLQQSDFAGLHRLLVPLLLQRASQFIGGVDLEMAVLLGESRIPDFETVGWQELIQTLSEPIQGSLTTWLFEWHSEHRTIPLVGDGADDAATQHITISVDVPNVDMVFRAALIIPEMLAFGSSHTPVVTLGQPMQTTVRISHTTNWSAKSIFPSVPTFRIHRDDERQSSFVCNVGAESDTWIIGGQRRWHFTPQEGLEDVFSVVLIPLRLGVHALPMVEVQQEASDPEANHNAGEHSVSCETHYESAGQLVHVIRDVRSSKIHIQESTATTTTVPSRPGTASTTALG